MGFSTTLVRELTNEDSPELRAVFRMDTVTAACPAIYLLTDVFFIITFLCFLYCEMTDGRLIEKGIN